MKRSEHPESVKAACRVQRDTVQLVSHTMLRAHGDRVVSD